MGFPSVVTEIARFVGEMAWQLWWGLILGFTISGAVQAFVSRERMSDLLGGRGPEEVGLATFFGFLSSSCSFAAVATARSLFRKGASPEAAFAGFMFASTNLVIELGLVMWVLLGWQFVLADFVGGLVMITLLALLTRFVIPDAWFVTARENAAGAEKGMQMDTLLSLLVRVPKAIVAHRSIPVPAGGDGGETTHSTHSHDHDHDTDREDTTEDDTTSMAGVLSVDGWKHASQNAISEWRMVWSDILIGFLIAGTIATVVPDSAWTGLFSIAPEGTFAWVAFGSVIGVTLAVCTFLCSVGNVPFALVLWNAGIPFGGVLAFIFGDLIIPNIDNIYRKYYGLRMAGALFVSMFAVAVVTGILIYYLATWIGLIPQHGAGGTAPKGYTLVLNALLTPVLLTELYVTYRS